MHISSPSFFQHLQCDHSGHVFPDACGCYTFFFGRLDTAPLGDVTAYFFLSLASLSCCCFHCSSSLIFYVWRVAQAIPFFWQAVRHLCFFLFLLFRWRDYKYILRKRPCNKIMIIMAFGIGTLARRNRV